MELQTNSSKSQQGFREAPVRLQANQDEIHLQALERIAQSPLRSLFQKNESEIR